MAHQPENLPAPATLTIGDLAGLFLDHSQRHHAPDTYSLYKHYLLNFTTNHGKILVHDIKPFHITKWLDLHPSWKTSRRHAALAIKRAYSWGIKQGLFTVNPVTGFEVDPLNRRERVLSDGERSEILGAVKDVAFKEFLTAMFETGSRPGEVARVAAENVVIDKGIGIFKKHKTSKETGRDRIVYLNSAMEEMTKRLMALRPTGPLFVNKRGTAFTRNAIRCRFMRLREKLPHIPHFVAYNARHTFVTNSLMNNVGVAQVAALVGHTSTEMVNRTYSHLAAQIAHMREAARQATAT